jgi:alkylation response protein AidB-like acyl-CoA dehydrogenase
MKFILTEEQKGIKKIARELAEEEFPRIWEENYNKELFPEKIWKKACELGLIGVTVPERYGGSGLGMLDEILVIEELQRINPRIATLINFTTYGNQIIEKFGTKEQKEAYLPLIVKGEETLSSTLFSEEIDPLKVRVDRDKFEINGKIKVEDGAIFATSNFKLPSNLLVLCEGESGKDIILVETAKSIEAKNVTFGIGAPPIIELLFNNTRAASRNLIGERGKGLTYAAFFLNIARVEIAAQAIGCAQCALETSLHFINERKKAGRQTWHYQDTSYKIAEIATEIEATRLLLYKAGLAIDEGAPDSRLAAMAKWKAGSLATMAVDEAIGLHEGMGFIDDYYAERFRKSAKITHRAPGIASTRNIKISEILFKGTDEIARYFTD